ncbi:restriction system-associated AAA family ATPase [Chryseobacterium balustinum]|uniref:Predicted ATP-binding protein involved in virulence n=1 Tax=Chryseobacterium balustinum TaxID=246 RepID=A0AAX2IK15_9FLAO|nr:restriction system-associated AAA family ATPase [Chryseobacterium balustinum]SKB49840.1 restriction system-associated AAA family ATPase [Chryseobacterium balustinum]SQA89010.1 Predicted ATP-binding protein involved in virulence [Chryseobacterium balustinum]
MKLIRFKVNTPEGFRSLQSAFEIYFLRDFDYQLAHDFNPNILAGRNGSGKSNILEALANIFYHLDCMNVDNLPQDFLQSEENQKGFDNRVCIVDAFELEYFIDIPMEWCNKSNTELLSRKIYENLGRIKISKEVGETPVFEWVNRSDFTDNTAPLGKKDLQQLLPKYVLGYSSGENELLSLPFFKTRFLHFDEYADKLIREDSFGFPPKSEGRLVYLDKEYSQAILLTNLLMQDEKTLAPFNEEVELEDIDEFRLIIRMDEYLDLHEDILRDRTVNLDDKRTYQVQLTSNLKDSIGILKQCATCYETRIIEQDNGEEVNEYLILDFKVTEATKEAFRFHFANEEYNQPLQLFQLFQILLELNAYVASYEDKKRVYQSKNIFINHDINPIPLEDNRILRFKNLWINKKGLSKPLFTKELSDGEHQFLHSLGLCLLFKNENCLFLLDEPETHFNPDWKSKFISSIRHCFALDESNTMREMLITTHSPYLISDSESKYVHIFSKESETKNVNCGYPEFQTLGTSVNKITLRIFNKPETIGEFANQKIDELRKELENTDDKEKFLIKVRKEIGESVESVLFINDIIDQIENK